MKASNVLLGVLAGVALGATLGILYAPDKGASTRDKISKKGQKYVKDVKDKTHEFADTISQKVQHVKEEGSRMADNWKNKAREVEADVKRKV